MKGFTLNDERLKQVGGGNYLDELPVRIRDIHSMKDWLAKVDDFLKLSEREILTH